MIWGGEFGRTPMSEKGNGRDHNPYGFTMWMAGGGCKAGTVIGATDEIGLHAVDDRSTSTTCTPRSCTCWAWTTCKLTYLHNGRDERRDGQRGEAC